MLTLLLIIPLIGILLLLPIKEEVLTPSYLLDKNKMTLNLIDTKSDLTTGKESYKLLSLELKKNRSLMKQIALIISLINLFISILI
jgi:hypothetical protein